MDAIGNEIGQKMRSAIKAKLMELGSYVDDELPDYIMVMVANKRTKSQMELDLQLFLRSNTKVFVEWLQQVLKKLKEVRLTNPEMYNELKRKTSIEMAEVVVKKEKNKRIKLEKSGNSMSTLLSENIPVQAATSGENKAAKQNFDLHQNNESTSNNSVNEDNFDIPTISEVNLLEEAELEEVADRIKKAKLALLKSDSEEEEDFINFKTDTDELRNELSDLNTSINVENTQSTKQTIVLNRQRKFISNTKNQDNIEKPKQRTLKDLRQSLINSRNANAKSLESKSSEIRSNTPPLKRTISLSERLREEKEISGKIFGNAISKLTHKKDEQKATVERRREEKRVEKNHSREEKEKKKSVHSRLGVASGIPSMVSVPNKKSKIQEHKSPERPSKVVPSMVQVKPRKTSGFCQANKALLLKAVAEAQRSVNQVPSKHKKEILEDLIPESKKTPNEVSSKESRIMKTFNENKPALFTKKYKEQIQKRKLEKATPKHETTAEGGTPPRKRTKHIVVEVKNKETSKPESDIEEDSLDSKYVSKTLKNNDKTVKKSNFLLNRKSIQDEEDLDNYVGEMESFNEDSFLSNEENVEDIPLKPQTKHQFIVTLDGIKDKLPFKKDGSFSPTNMDDSPKSKGPPSPIVFEQPKLPEQTSSKPVRNIPDTLPKVPIPTERCKFWPQCRLGEKCEFVHPSSSCKMFPNCKFGDRCIYIHPKCKFLTSCTRKDCPYSHIVNKAVPKIAVKSKFTYHPSFHSTSQEVCKYFPSCANPKCTFYHPKPCKFGVACLNKSECGYSHNVIPSKEKLTWHSVK